MLIEAAPARALGSDRPRLAFGEGERGAGRGERLLLLDGEPAYELSYSCGTCQFLFRRRYGATGTLSVDELRQRLTEGLTGVDDEVVAAFGSLLGRGTYVPLLLSVRPRLVVPGGPGDYYAHEQVVTWGVESFSGLPEYPATAYYRTFETPVDDRAHLYEFVVPMLAPAWDRRERVAEMAGRLAGSELPTAVAVSTVDVCLPALDRGTDYYEHWGLSHFLLDGHHKMHAAADAGLPLRLLSLLSVEASLATPEQVARIPELRARQAAAR